MFQWKEAVVTSSVKMLVAKGEILTFGKMYIYIKFILVFITCIKIAPANGNTSTSSHKITFGIVDDELRQVCYTLLESKFTDVSFVKFQYGILLKPSTFAQDAKNLANYNLSAVIYEYNYQLAFLTNATGLPYYVIMRRSPVEMPTNLFVVESSAFDVVLALYQFTTQLKKVTRLVILCDEKTIFIRDEIIKTFSEDLSMILVFLEDNFTNEKARSQLLQVPSDQSGSTTVFALLISDITINRTVDILDQALLTGHMNKLQVWFLVSLGISDDVLLRYSITRTYIVTLRTENGQVNTVQRRNELICEDAVYHYLTSVANQTNLTDIFSLLKKSTHYGNATVLQFSDQSRYSTIGGMKYISTDYTKPNTIQQIGIWSASGNTVKANLSAPWVKGIGNFKLRVAVFPQKPYFFRSESGAILGFCKDLFDQFKEVKIEWVEVQDNSTFGSYNAMNGTWDGIMGLLVDGKADVSGVPFFKTLLHRRFIDFTAYVKLEGFDFVIRKPVNQYNWLKLLRPFTLVTWVVIVVVFLLSCIFLLIINTASPNMIKEQNTDDTWRPATFGDIIFVMFSTMTVSTHDFHPRMLSYRVFTIFLTCGAMLLVASYAANLSGEITGQLYQPHTQYNSLDAIYENRNHLRWFFDKDYHPFEEIYTSGEHNGSQFLSYAENNWQTHLFEYSIEKIEKRLLANENDVFIGRYSLVQYLTLKNCNFQYRSAKFTKINSKTYMGISKNYNQKQYIKDKVDELRTDGKFSSIWKKWITFIPCRPNRENTVVSIRYINSIFFIVAGGVILGLIAGCCEFTIRKVRILKFRRSLPKFLFGSLYDATIIKTEQTGAWVHVKGRKTEQYFIRNSHLDPNPIKVSRPEELNLEPNSVFKVRYLGKNPKKRTRRLIRVTEDN